MKFSDIHISIISHHRPQNVEKMEKITDLGGEINWYLGKNEKKDYSHAKGTLHEAGTLLEARNAALRDAAKKKKWCLQLDDDLMEIFYIQNKNTQHQITFKNMIKEMYDVLSSMPVGLAGVAPTINPFFYNPQKPIGLKHFIIGSCFLVKQPIEIFFDESLKTKEDYDYTLQHIKQFGGVCRLNYLAPRFLHYGNEGGVVEYRTDTIEQDSIAKLKKKWGSVIRDNPKRPNEILLKIK